jgi:hypothetical protein
VDPFDVKYLGLSWLAYYVDTSVPFGCRHGTLACVRVTDLIRYIFSCMGILVLKYIDDIIGIAPNDLADSHFQLTLSTLNNLGFQLNNSKTIPPTSMAICLGISFNIEIETLRIPPTKLQEVLSLCKIYISKSKITKNQLQALLGSLMFLHKAIKPARLFVNRILALLRDMGPAASAAIDKGTRQDLRWFIACAHVANGTISIYKCLHPQTDRNPLLHSIARNVHLLEMTLDCDLAFSHVPGWLNTVADLLSHWDASARPMASLFTLLNTTPVWCPVPAVAFELDCTI